MGGTQVARTITRMVLLGVAAMVLTLAVGSPLPNLGDGASANLPEETMPMGPNALPRSATVQDRVHAGRLARNGVLGATSLDGNPPTGSGTP